jgi:hypothetical protein
MHKEFWWKNLNGRDHLGELDADGRLLGRILGKYDVRIWTG